VSTQSLRTSRRDRILDAAIQAFASRGFHGASTREIAELAGVTDPLLFYHFKTKADLYLAAVEDQLEKLREGLEEAMAGVTDIEERLRRFATVYLAYFLDYEPGLTVTLVELQGVPAEAAEAITRIHHRGVVARLEEILRDGVAQGVFRPLNIRTCALAIMGILQIFIRVDARTPGSIPRADVIAQIMEHYAPGLRAGPWVE
jgi:TetR/AcrR family transcriptional regulator, cholesterol catabolism regulator